jgi:hypothetical protein
VYACTEKPILAAPGAIMTAPALAREQASLAAWYGEPLAASDAGRLCADAERLLRSRLCTGLPVFQLQVMHLLGRYWMGSSISLEYRHLAASTRVQRDRALLEIVFGQLLMSHKQRPALRHLDSGFRLAAKHIEAVDYFRLVRRHDLLRYLPLSDEAAAPQGLQSLLAEAAVIRQLRGAERYACGVSHHDTVG